MSLSTAFVSKPPSDVGGPIAANRLEYQQSWALCEILSFHTAGEDYFVVFDYHNDVVIFDKEDDPQSITLVQVKTRRGKYWNTADLTKNKSGQLGTSILAQLYTSHKTFETYCKGLRLLSNQGWSCKKKSDNHNVIHESVEFADLCINVKNKVHIAVEGHDSPICDVAGLSKIELEVTNLSLDDHSTHAKGRLTDFFENNYGRTNIRISPVYQTLMGEIRRKNNNEQTHSTWDELKRFKGLGRVKFEEMMSHVVDSNDKERPWNEIQVLLSNEGYSFSELRQLKPFMSEVFLRKTAQKADSLSDFFTAIIEEIKSFESSNMRASVRDVENYLVKHGSNRIRLSHLESRFIQAAVIHEFIS